MPCVLIRRGTVTRDTCFLPLSLLSICMRQGKAMWGYGEKVGEPRRKTSGKTKDWYFDLWLLASRWWEINFSCLCYPICGILLYWLQKINISLIRYIIYIFSHFTLFLLWKDIEFYQMLFLCQLIWVCNLEGFSFYINVLC